MLLFFSLFSPFYYLPIQCEQIMSIAPPAVIETAEDYLLKKTIKYRYGANGPEYYDCGAVLTEAYRKTY